MSKLRIIGAIVIYLGCLAALGCIGKGTRCNHQSPVDLHPNQHTIRYYLSRNYPIFVWESEGFRDEVDEQTAMKLRTFYKLESDSNGLPRTMDRILGGGLLFRHHYEYDKKGQLIRTIVIVPGREPVTVEHADKNGRKNSPHRFDAEYYQ